MSGPIKKEFSTAGAPASGRPSAGGGVARVTTALGAAVGGGLGLAEPLAPPLASADSLFYGTGPESSHVGRRQVSYSQSLWVFFRALGVPTRYFRCTLKPFIRAEEPSRPLALWGRWRKLLKRRSLGSLFMSQQSRKFLTPAK